jgi:Family of unknown function (DUF6328)
MSHATFETTRHQSGDAAAGDAGTTDPDETPEQRLQREHEQLFHELRAIIPGVEVLFAFMLTVAFTERFQQLTDVQRWVYYLTFLCAGVGLLLLLAPASYHRVQFRRGDKEAMMRIANIEALTALIVISLAVAGTVFLITDLMFSTVAAAVVATSMWLMICVLWWVVPLTRRLREAAAAG